MGMEVSVDRGRCVGAGQCVFAAPEVFGQSEDNGLVALFEVEPSPELSDAVHDAEHLCPALAIEVRESSGNR